MADTYTFDIPDAYYEHGTPYRTNYMGDDRQGLAYLMGGEQAWERRAATGATHDWSVISLCSPYITGFASPTFGGTDPYAADLEVVAVDIPGRKVTLRLKEQA